MNKQHDQDTREFIIGKSNSMNVRKHKFVRERFKIKQNPNEAGNTFDTNCFDTSNIDV